MRKEERERRRGEEGGGGEKIQNEPSKWNLAFCNLILEMTSYFLGCILLTRSRYQVLPTLTLEGTALGIPKGKTPGDRVLGGLPRGL